MSIGETNRGVEGVKEKIARRERARLKYRGRAVHVTKLDAWDSTL